MWGRAYQVGIPLLVREGWPRQRPGWPLTPHMARERPPRLRRQRGLCRNFLDAAATLLTRRGIHGNLTFSYGQKNHFFAAFSSSCCSICSSFFTSNVPGTPRAAIYASWLSPSFNTTPFKVT